MPNLITHIWFGEEVLKGLPSDLSEKILKHKDAFILGNMGPDFMYAIRELGFSTGNYPNELHHNRTWRTFEAIAKYLRENNSPRAFSYGMGMLCHYCADKNLHSFVNALCEGYVSVELGGEALPCAHGFIESGIDTFVITDRMGIKDPNKYRPDKALKSKRKTRKAIAKMFMACVDEIHGKKITVFKTSLSFELTRLFIWFANDKSGLKHPFVRGLEKTLMGNTMQVTALMRPPIKYGEIDYLNFEKRPYRKYRNADELVNYNAMEVLEIGIDEAVNHYIPAFKKDIEEGVPMNRSDFDVNYEGVIAGNDL